MVQSERPTPRTFQLISWWCSAQKGRREIELIVGDAEASDQSERLTVADHFVPQPVSVLEGVTHWNLDPSDVTRRSLRSSRPERKLSMHKTASAPAESEGTTVSVNAQLQPREPISHGTTSG